MHILRKVSFFLSLIIIGDFVITDEEEEFLEKPIEGKAKFKTLPIHVMVNEGETIRLPCFVDKIEGYVLLWKFGDGDNILSVGSKVVSSDREKRIMLEEEKNGNYLVINSATSKDSGNYDCHISDYVPLEIRHSVIVRTRPEVTVDRRQVEVEEGEDVRLTCRLLSGIPAPEISWIRNGSVVAFSEELVLRSVSRLDSDRYSCRADNGYTEDFTVAVQLNVAHSPVILNTSSEWVHASGASNLTLSCEVSSSPPAQLTWFKGDTELPSSLQSNRSPPGSVQVWTLYLDKSSDMQDDQHYWCVANNSLGLTKRMITLTNKPSVPTLNINKTSKMVSWSIQSEATLTSSLLELSSQGKTSQFSVTPVQTERGYWTGSWISDSDAQYKVRIRGINSFGNGPFSDWMTHETNAGTRFQVFVVCQLISLMVIFVST